MAKVKKVTLPLTDEVINDLYVGDMVELSGVIYTARDKAHKRFVDLIHDHDDLPVDLHGQIIYYVGPTPSKPGQTIGSCGPTTSSRMDAFAPVLMDEAGLKGMLGKGPRDKDVVDAMIRDNCIYLVTIGGTGALLASCVKSSEVVAYEDLASCAVRKLEVENLPCIVAIDHKGSNLFEIGVAKYRRN